MPQGTPLPLAPPLLGVRGDVVPYEIPPGYLWRSINVVDRYGRLRTRQGLSAVATTGPGERITGGLSFKTSGGTRQTVAAGTTKWFRTDGSAWTDISGAQVFAASAENPTRFTMFPSSGKNWLIGVNNSNLPFKWDGVTATVEPLGGDPPTARDVTVASNFVVLGNVQEDGVRASSRVRVSNFNDLDTWDQYGPADLTDTNDDIVAVRALNRTDFAIYKEQSVWMAFAQLNIFPFRFETIDYQPGPVSPSAVVRFGQTHYYFGIDGRIYRFDGRTLQPVSRAIEYYLVAAGQPTTFRTEERARCFGFYTAVDRCIWFFIPGPTDVDPTVAITVNVDTGAIYPHVFPFPVSAGWEGFDASTIDWSDLLIYPDWVGGAFEATYPSWDSFGGTLSPTCFIGSVGGQVYRQRYDAADDIYPIPQIVEFPLKPWLGIDQISHIDGLETFVELTSEGVLVRLDIGSSDALAEAVDPTYTTIGQHDTRLTTRQKFNTTLIDARFYSFRMAWTSVGPVQFKGGMANAWQSSLPEAGERPVTLLDIPPILVSPSTGVDTVTVPGTFSGDYMVAVETSWPTQYGIPEATKTAVSFVIELGTPVPPGGVIRCKVITS